MLVPEFLARLLRTVLSVRNLHYISKMRNPQLFMRLSCLSIIICFCTTVFCQDMETTIDERLINCVVHLTIPAPDPKYTGFGTGFLVGVRNPDASIKKVYLVTNKHMVGSWSLVDPFIPYDSVIIDLYTDEKSKLTIQKIIKLKTITGRINNNVILHPNHRVDVALIDLTEMNKENSKSGIFWQISDTNFLMRSDEMQEWKISYGEQVFAIGYPANVKITGSNLPIAKSGYIASSTAGNFRVEFPVVSRKKDTIIASPEGNFYLVDGLIIGGNSGGPVLSPNRTSLNFTENKQNIVRTRRATAIIGIVSMVLDGTGIAVIYSSNNILELIDASLGKNQK
jgi:hypothetical protein